MTDGPGVDDSALAALLAAAPVAAVVVGRDHTIRAWNPAASAITGWAAEDVLGRTDPLVAPEDRERSAAELEELLASGREPGRVVLQRVRSDGTRFQLCLESAAPVELEDGRGVALWFSEVSDLEALVLHRSRLSRELVDATRIDEVVPLLTEAVIEVLGATSGVVLRPDLGGTHLRGDRGLGMPAEVVEAIELELTEGAPWTAAASGTLADGQLELGQEVHPASFVPMGPEDEGWVLVTIGTRAEAASAHVGDLFHAVANEAWGALQRAELVARLDGRIENLEELDRAKADWMAGVTHDLKAPVTTLLGFVETLRRMIGQVTEDEQRRFLEIMSRQANRLVELIEDLLLSARVEADAAARRREPVDVDELVPAALESIDRDDLHRVEVVTQGDGGPVLGDRAHLHRVLVNLFTNALVHGGHQTRITVQHRDEDVVVVVEDDGPGVPAPDRDRIFDRFVHGEHESSSGLGLYVARGIAEAHGGSLVVVDRPDGEGGARFELHLPRRTDEHPEDGGTHPGEDRRRQPGPGRRRL